MSEARSAALPACSDGFDNVDGGPECGVYIQMSGVEQVRVGSRFERSSRAFGVALVAPANIGQHVGIADALAGPLQLGSAAAGADLGTSGDEDFYLGAGKDNGSDIAPVEHGTGRGAPEIALEREQCGAHLRNGRDD